MIRAQTERFLGDPQSGGIDIDGGDNFDQALFDVRRQRSRAPIAPHIAKADLNHSVSHRRDFCVRAFPSAPLAAQTADGEPRDEAAHQQEIDDDHGTGRND